MKTVFIILSAWFALSQSPLARAADDVVSEHVTVHSKKMKKSEFKAAMRALWIDHVVWTRQYIVSSVAELPDAQAAAARLLRNQVDIGNAIKPFYGENAGNELTQLLTEHIIIATHIIADALAGDTDQLEADTKAWYANADEIAVFLHKANPKHWPLDEMKAMLKAHLDATTRELLARLAGNWEEDVNAFDAVVVQIYAMSDMLAKGIVKQFRCRFKWIEI